MQAWESFLQKLEIELGQATISKWLRPLKVIHFDACNLYLETADTFQHLFFEEHVRPRLRKEFLNNNNHQIKVHLSVISDEKQKDEAGKKSDKSRSEEFEIKSDPLDPWATFENFIQSEANKVPFQLLCEMGGYSPKGKGKEINALGAINPIYLYGNSGTGKTHLLMACAQQLIQQGKNVLFLSAETFTQHVISAIRSGNMQNFRRIYRNADVLILDDIQLLARRSATQEELFHTFNSLHSAGKQILLSGNCPAGLLPSIEERLISRFEWGICLPLEKLSAKEELAMVEVHAEAMQFPLEESAIEYICQNFGSNTHSLHKAIEALILRVHLQEHEKRSANKKISLSAATLESALAELSKKEKENQITPQKIIKAVADYYGIKAEDILGRAQSQECSLPRQIAMHICRQVLGIPFIKIGTLFSRDHSTVMSGIKHIQKKLDEKDKALCTSVPEILRLVTAETVSL